MRQLIDPVIELRVRERWDAEYFVVITDHRYVGGVPAGFFEVDHRRAGEVELKYFGLAPEFRGRGIGKWLLNEAVVFCWSWAPTRVIVETCTLDSPAALPLYQRMGFAPYDRQHKVVTLPS